MVQDSSFSPAKFHMWRCVTAMAHADGLVQGEERAYLEQIFRNMKERAGLSEEQLSTLMSDLDQPQDPGNMLRQINDPKFRGQAVYFARLLAHKDGVFHPAEEELLKKLHANALDGTDFEAIQKEVRDHVKQELSQHDAKMEQNRIRGGLFGLLDQFMEFFGY